MSDSSQQPIVVKRIKKGGGGAHGGAWKIAYADFVTAMMAFFLLMWLLGSTTKGDLKGIADYFQSPLKLSLQGGPGSGAASTPIEGGGQDLTKAIGEVARGKYTPSPRPEQVRVDAQKNERDLEQTEVVKPDARSDAAAAEAEARERVMLNDLKASLEALIEASPVLREFKNQLLLDITSEGLRVQIVDEKNRPMFDSASATLKPYTQEILRAIGEALNAVPNKISISGHTDAARYAGGGLGFSNWELSANRANACRRELLAGGIADDKIIRVVGLASTIPLDRSDPYNPINRRISIVVMNRKAAEAVMQEGRTVDVHNDAQLELAPLASEPPEAAQAEPAPRQSGERSRPILPMRLRERATAASG